MASRTASPLTHPEPEEFDLVQVMRALTDPLRLGIVATLASRPDLTCNLVYRDVTASVLTRHYRVLREAGVIRQWDVGIRRYSAIRKAELDLRFPGLIDLVIAESMHYAFPAESTVV